MPIEITVDHKPALQAEMERIHRAGGKITNNRVQGVIAVSRSFGDIEYNYVKEQSWGKSFDDDLIIATPDIFIEKRVPQEDEFLIIASDGLWDAFPSQKVVNMFRKFLVDMKGSIDDALTKIVEEAKLHLDKDDVNAIEKDVHEEFIPDASTLLGIESPDESSTESLLENESLLGGEEPSPIIEVKENEVDISEDEESKSSIKEVEVQEVDISEDEDIDSDIIGQEIENVSIPSRATPSISGEMSVRPTSLPATAELDPKTGRWMINGVPVGPKVTATGLDSDSRNVRIGGEDPLKESKKNEEITTPSGRHCEFSTEMAAELAEMAEIAELVGTTSAEVLGTCSFYEMFKRHPVGKYVINICTTMSCALMGAGDLMEHAELRLGVKSGSTTADGMFTLEGAECQAACTEAPCLQVNYRHQYRVTTNQFDALIEELSSSDHEVPEHGVLSQIRQHIPENRFVGVVPPEDVTAAPVWLNDNGSDQ